MSHSLSISPDRRSECSQEETVSTEREISELLTVLDDEDCRAVLEATGGEPLSAKEIAERCEIPSSTAYRKIDRLVDTGLLEEGIRIRSTGKHASEYSCAVDRVALSIGDAGTELQVERSTTDPRHPTDRHQAAD